MQFSISREAPVLLPLNSLGNRPYWFVATARITAASEILCSKDGNPHCDTEMPVLAQEAYYSAALDGAPGDSSLVQEAMSFSDSILHSPLTSSTMMKLAGMLAGPSVTCKSPRHESHVEELVRFLRDPHFHPLVKGTIAHAYILATQPLTVGNGRLARLLTHIVLLRSGYSYLLNASLSAVIARHSAVYISAVRSIFLPENAGSLTGFLEFMMEMLVETYREGTIDGEYVEGVQYSESSLSEAEQQTVPSDESETDDDPESDNPPALSDNGESMTTDNQPTLSDSEETITVAGITLDANTDMLFYNKLTEMESSWKVWNHTVASAIREFLHDGILEFTYEDCMRRTGWSITEYRRAYSLLRKREMMVNTLPAKNRHRHEPGHYRFLLRSAESIARLEPEHPNTNIPGLLPPSLFWDQVEKMENSSSNLSRKGAATIKDMISHGIMEFRSLDLKANAHMSFDDFNRLRSRLITRHLIINLNRLNEERNFLSGRYRFALGDEATETSGDGAHPELDSSAFWNLISAMDINRSESIRRIAQAIRDFISAGKLEFIPAELFTRAGLKGKKHHYLTEWLVFHGVIVRAEKRRGAPRPYRYRFTIIIRTPEDAVPPEIPHTPMGKCLYQMEYSKSPTLRRSAVIVRDMIREGITEFTTDQWFARTGMSVMEFDNVRYTLFHHGVLEGIKKKRRSIPGKFCIYRFVLQADDLQPQVAPGSASTPS